MGKLSKVFMHSFLYIIQYCVIALLCLGLADDWGISEADAKATLDAWYKDRPEVKKWQDDTKETALNIGKVNTMYH